MAMIEPQSCKRSLKTQAAMPGISRSSLYYCPLPPSPEEVAIKHRIDEIYMCWPFYGSRRITAQEYQAARQMALAAGLHRLDRE